MTVAELIEELKQLPQHHPVLCETGLKYAESIECITSEHLRGGVGPAVIINTGQDKRNVTCY